MPRGAMTVANNTESRHTVAAQALDTILEISNSGWRDRALDMLLPVLAADQISAAAAVPVLRRRH